MPDFFRTLFIGTLLLIFLLFGEKIRMQKDLDHLWKKQADLDHLWKKQADLDLQLLRMAKEGR